MADSTHVQRLMVMPHPPSMSSHPVPRHYHVMLRWQCSPRHLLPRPTVPPTTTTTTITTTTTAACRATSIATSAAHARAACVSSAQEGLRMMRKLGPEINVPIHVYGPETHMTAVVQLALGIPMPDSMRMESSVVAAEFERLSHESGVRPFSPRAVMSPSMAAAGAGAGRAETPPVTELGAPATPTAVEPGRPSRRTFCYCTPPPPHCVVCAGLAVCYDTFSPTTRCIVYGLQNRAVQVSVVQRRGLWRGYSVCGGVVVNVM
jgi:hypothetical protein